MLNAALDLARPMLRALDPERAHEMTLRALEAWLIETPAPDNPCLEAKVFDWPLANPIGVAAGFDKDARVPNVLLRAGFGFAEVGTLTPKPQAGNPKPRVFRIAAEDAIINRNGFNNQGHAAARERLSDLDDYHGIGVNIGANKDATDRIADYVAGISTFNGLAHYFTVNISSPNTPGLRDLQAPKELEALLAAVIAERDRLGDTAGRRTPVVVKLAPDIADDDMPAIVDVIVSSGADAIAISNTTIARDRIEPTATNAQEAGGLSGPPLFEPSTRMLAQVYRHSGGQLPLIGIGGISSGETALAKITAGASLIQLYTGLVYRGIPLLGEIKRTLVDATKAAGAENYSALIGSKNAAWQ